MAADVLIIHLYNSTSPAQREIVFKKSKKEIITIAVDAVKQIRDLSTKYQGKSFFNILPRVFLKQKLSLPVKFVTQL